MARQPTRVDLMEETEMLRRQLSKTASDQAASRDGAEWALRERIKELDCLYAISRLRERHFPLADRFLQAVVDCLPKSFQFPDLACARVSCGDRQYVSAAFQESPWRIAADVKIDGRPNGVVEVFYRRLPPTAAENVFLREEHILMAGVVEQVASVLGHMRAETDLREAHKALQYEHQALQEMNITLRTVLSRLEDEKREIRFSILSNIQKILMPIVFELELEVSGRQRSFVTLLRQNLQEIASPFLTQMCRSHVQLTPVEIAVSTMVRNGLSSKEIAQIRCISPATVRRHRENIRRKLGLRNNKANLVTFLQSTTQNESRPPE